MKVAPQAHRKFLDAVAYRRTDRALRALGAVIGSRSAAGRPQRFSMVLVESALWTQFVVSPQEQILDIDAGGPNKGDLVAVTGEPVIYAMRKGKLQLAEAVEFGMIKLYGEPGEIDRFLAAYGDVGAETMPGCRAPRACPGRFRFRGTRVSSRYYRIQFNPPQRPEKE